MIHILYGSVSLSLDNEADFEEHERSVKAVVELMKERVFNELSHTWAVGIHQAHLGHLGHTVAKQHLR